MSRNSLAGASLIGLASGRPRLTRAVSSALVHDCGFTVVSVDTVVQDSVEGTHLLDVYDLRAVVGEWGWEHALASKRHGSQLRVLLDTYRRSRPAAEWADMLTTVILDLGGPGPQAPIVVTDAIEAAICDRIRDLGGTMWGLAMEGCGVDITINRPKDLVTLGLDVDRALRWSALAHQGGLVAQAA